MANLLEVAELCWRQCFPNPTDEVKTKKEEFISTAKVMYATEMWILMKEEKREEGFWNIPSWLLAETELDVVNNEMDISSLSAMFSLSDNIWIQNIGGINCDCKYVSSTVNLTQLLCGDDSLGDGVRTFIVVGKKIKFPLGTHKTPLPVIYAKTGSDIDDEEFDVDDMVAGIIRTKLYNLYSGKEAKSDVTNNSNPND